jgi:4a-hydroxytetrahydrobiopterin dehydratase
MASCSLGAAPAGKCAPCEGLDDSAKLSLDAAKSMQQSVPCLSLWTIVEKKDANNGMLTLNYTYTAKNFQAALDSINAIGAIAEREGHHPNLHLTNYRDVRIEIYTHKLGGLSNNDFVLAEKISKEVQIEYSPKWLRENPAATYCAT